MAESNTNNEPSISADIWGLVLLSQQANSLLAGTIELIDDGPDNRTFDCLQIIEVAIEKLRDITRQYHELKIDKRLEAVEMVMAQEAA